MKTLRNIIKFPFYLTVQVIIIVFIPVWVFTNIFGLQNFSGGADITKYPYSDPRTLKEWVRRMKDTILNPYEMYYGK